MNTALFDKEGFLTQQDAWNQEMAFAIAEAEGIALTDAHMEIINTLREFYHQHEVAPANRPFVKLIKNTYGPEKGNSIYLMTLFPESPAKLAAKIAGLPKPANCL